MCVLRTDVEMLRVASFLRLVVEEKTVWEKLILCIVYSMGMVSGVLCPSSHAQTSSQSVQVPIPFYSAILL